MASFICTNFLVAPVLAAEEGVREDAHKHGMEVHHHATENDIRADGQTVNCCSTEKHYKEAIVNAKDDGRLVLFAAALSYFDNFNLINPEIGKSEFCSDVSPPSQADALRSVVKRE